MLEKQEIMVLSHAKSYIGRSGPFAEGQMIMRSALNLADSPQFRQLAPLNERTSF